MCFPLSIRKPCKSVPSPFGKLTKSEISGVKLEEGLEKANMKTNNMLQPFDLFIYIYIHCMFLKSLTPLLDIYD